MLTAYVTCIFSIFIRGRTEIALPGLVNETGLFTGFSSQTFQNNLYCKLEIEMNFELTS